MGPRMEPISGVIPETDITKGDSFRSSPWGFLSVMRHGKRCTNYPMTHRVKVKLV